MKITIEDLKTCFKELSYVLGSPTDPAPLKIETKGKVVVLTTTGTYGIISTISQKAEVLEEGSVVIPFQEFKEAVKKVKVPIGIFHKDGKLFYGWEDKSAAIEEVDSDVKNVLPTSKPNKIAVGSWPAAAKVMVNTLANNTKENCKVAQTQNGFGATNGLKMINVFVPEKTDVYLNLGAVKFIASISDTSWCGVFMDAESVSISSLRTFMKTDVPEMTPPGFKKILGMQINPEFTVKGTLRDLIKAFNSLERDDGLTSFKGQRVITKSTLIFDEKTELGRVPILRTGGELVLSLKNLDLSDLIKADCLAIKTDRDGQATLTGIVNKTEVKTSVAKLEGCKVTSSADESRFFDMKMLKESLNDVLEGFSEESSFELKIGQEPILRIDIKDPSGTELAVIQALIEDDK